jgi:hypothetical protein
MIRLEIRFLTIVALVLVSACSSSIEVGKLDTGAGRLRLLNDSRSQVFSLTAEGRDPVALGDLREARILGAWGNGKFMTAVVAGSTGTCRSAYALIDISPEATSPATRLPDCAPTRFTFDGTTVVATSTRIWRFVSGFLYGPYGRTVTRNRTPVKNSRNANEILLDAIAPPPVSGEASEDVIPQSVGSQSVPKPAVVNLR